MNMKRILLFLFVLVATFAAKAADDKSLFIKFYDGSKMEFVMSANPEISMANDVMTITSNGTTSTYDLWKVSEFTFGESTGIHNLVVDKDVKFSGNQIVVPEGGARVRIFSVDGKDVSIVPINVSGHSIIDLNSLTKGVYIVNVNGKSVKVSKK